MLGHELTHVLQQRAGRVRNPMGTGVAVVQDPALEAEAERMGLRAASASMPIQAKPAGTSPGGPRPAVAPVIPGFSAAAQPRRPDVGGPSPTRPGKPARPAPVQPRSRSVVPSGVVPVQVSPPTKTGEGSYRIVAGAVGQPVGSVMVHTRSHSTIEVTDLHVDPAHREQGLGGLLIASAMRAGQGLGRSEVILDSHDEGSGKLTRNQGMGFARAGTNELGYARLVAPIHRVLAGVGQAKIAPLAGQPPAPSVPSPSPARPVCSQEDEQEEGGEDRDDDPFDLG